MAPTSRTKCGEVLDVFILSLFVLSLVKRLLCWPKEDVAERILKRLFQLRSPSLYKLSRSVAIQNSAGLLRVILDNFANRGNPKKMKTVGVVESESLNSR